MQTDFIASKMQEVSSDFEEFTKTLGASYPGLAYNWNNIYIFRGKSG